MKALRRLTPLQRWMQKLNAKLAEYDLEWLVQVSLLGVIFVWLIYIEIFKPVIGP